MSNELKKRIITSFLLIVSLLAIYVSTTLFLYFLIIVSLGAFIEFSLLSKAIFVKNYYKQFFSNICFLLYVLFFSFIFYLSSINADTKIFIFLCLLICAASDIGGLITGKVFKGPKLTKISPNKTVSGSLGSFVFSIVTAITLTFYLLPIYSISKVSTLAFFISLGCQVGDIFFSFLKRKAKVKNTSNILPGHGGILDRIDGILLGIPFGMISTSLIYSIS